MADELRIDGTSVTTQELLDRAECMRLFALESFALRSRLITIDRLLSPSWLRGVEAPRDAMQAESDMFQAQVVMLELEAWARILQFGLGAAADGYAWVERFAGELGRQLLGGLATGIGRFLPGLAIGGTGALAAVGGLIAAARSTPGGLGALIGRLGSDEDALDTVPGISDPVSVQVLREATSALGSASLGALGVPPAAAAALGSAGLGASATAGGLLLAGSATGLVQETAVRLADSSPSRAVTPPSGFAERFDRIPAPSAEEGAQVVIERYEVPGEPDRFEVYIAGTVSFEPGVTEEPWDLASNLANAAGPGSGAFQAVSAAMHEAGVTAQSPVQFTGYSQGGATAARLAASGQWNTQGLVSFGGPTGQILLPPELPAVIVEHRDDPVPALGGVQRNQSAVLVDREVFTGTQPPPAGLAPAHDAAYYAQTAGSMDTESNPRLRAALATLDDFGANATVVTSTAYRFERVPAQ